MILFQRGILDLLKSALTGERIQLPDDFDWQTAFRLGKSHQILSMLYYGAINSELVLPEEIRAKLETATFQGVFIDRNQLHEVACIKEQFCRNGIAFLPLKGILLKSMYPHTDMRLMGDADILIKTEQYEAIKPIMTQLGYEEILESDHELIWDKRGVLHVELHKRLIPSYNKDYYAYFGDGWRLARETETAEYEMRDEDQFIYLFTHYAKHYRDAGIGIRHLIDLYVFLQAKTEFDWEYTERELEQLQLLKFCRNSLETLAVWFDGKEDSEMSDFMTDRIFGSGAYGTRENHLLSDGLKTSKTITKEQVKRAKMLKLIFPSAKVLSAKYTVLKKMPFLLPFIWVYRWIAAVLFKRKNIKVQREAVNMMSTENISSYQNELNFVGLDFNFEE